ncbi:MAG: extracellular solute-binding protein [Ruminococcaceae bacterium]|nr:extracellular solute-binding protein [Oscillospiraceae bacterium]
MKQTLSVLILAAMLCQLAACGASDTPAVDTTAAGTTEPEETTIAYVPAELDYGGETISFFIRENSATMPEFFADEQSGEIINDKIYARNLKVQEDLNVKFTFRQEKNSWNERKTFADTLGSSVLAGDGAYDIVSGYSMSLAILAERGLLCDLNSTAYLDFSKPWWAQSLTDQVTVNGKLFFATGDISTYTMYCMYGIYFNKNLLTDYGLEEPYGLVRDGKWTLDAMIGMTKDVYQDLNNNQTKDEFDQFGSVNAVSAIEAYYFTSGLHTTELDEKGIPYLSEDWVSEKAADVYETMRAFLNDTNDGWIIPDNVSSPFKDNRSLLTISTMSLGNSLREASFDYGIIPTPKYDEAQENYITHLTSGYSLYGIPMDSRDPDMVSAVLESLAGEGYTNVSPALLEVVMKEKYARDDDTDEMFDLIKSNLYFEFGRVFTANLDNLTYSIFRSGLDSNRGTWISTVNANMTRLNKRLETLLESFE